MIMASKALNFKLEENIIMDMKQVATVFNKTMTDVIKEAVTEYLDKMKQDPFYRLTIHVQDDSEEESEEILSEIETLSDDDLTITTVRRFDI